MVTPDARREAVAHLHAEHVVSERRACQVLGAERSVVRYRARRDDDAAVRARLRALASERRRFGYRRLGVLLAREGVVLNHKKLRRLYRLEKLRLCWRGGRKRALGAWAPLVQAAGPNRRWSLDFVSDVRSDGRRFRVLCVVDDCTRENLALVADTSLSGQRVIRDEGLVRNKAMHIALGVRADGTKEILGLWLEQNEGAKFWLRVMNELRNRGVEDVLLAVVDGLKGFPEAILAVFPEATVQTCIVHLLRHSLDFVSWKDRKPVAAALKDIYRAPDPAAAEAALAAFEAGPWRRKYAAIGQSWRRAWGEVVPFYAFPIEVRRLLYTTNAIEALNAKLRRAVRARGHFPTDEAALKLLFLVLNRTEKAWTMPPREWSMAKAQFAVLFGERFTRAMT
jgi:hypothetical protein